MLLADTEIWRLLGERIDELRHDRSERVNKGHCPTWGDYQREVGFIAALDQVVAMGQEVFGQLSGAPPLTADDDQEDDDL